MTGRGGIPLAGGRFLLRTHPDGSRQISWRLWVLIWVLPVTMLAAAAVLAIAVQHTRESWTETLATVTHVYDWENTAPQLFYPGARVYSPRFRYTWTDGGETEATTGASHTAWNFPIGSQHTIRFDPAAKGDVVLAGPSEWWVARVIALLGVVTILPGLIASALVLRWRARGA